MLGRVSLTYEVAVGIVRRLVHVFFRRVEVTGLQHVPPTGGGLVISWHPNGLVDPALILAEFPRAVVFGARHGLFKWPLLGRLMRALGTVPIYRASDTQAGDRRASNQRSLDALARSVAGGSFSALFPEGVSHDAPHLQDLKTGAARLYYRACELGDPESPPTIIPVGLHYNDKQLFRSRVLVEFHPALQLPSELRQPPADTLDEQQRRQHYRALTELFERTLHDVVHATESWELNWLMHRTRKLLRAERAHRAGHASRATDMTERALGFERVWAGYYARAQSHAEETQRLLARVAAYDRDLRALRLEDHELDQPTGVRVGLFWVLSLQVVMVYLLLPPILLVGYVVNGLPYVAVSLIARLGSKQSKDAATIKVLAGLLLFPAAWLGSSALVALGQLELHSLFAGVPRAPWAAACVWFVLSISGGLVALSYLRMLRDTWRALRVRITRRVRQRTIQRLLRQRASLHDEITELAAGLKLTGAVLPDGRVVEPAVEH